VSGGGGWGPKQGLLSLDPETSLARFAEARYDYDSNDSGNDDQVQALGNTAKPGSWIQFLIYHEASAGARGDDASSIAAAPSYNVVNSLAFGSIPSTIDDIPLPKSMSDVAGGNEGPGALIEGIEGHFGAQSEVGIYINLQKGDKVLSSKVDVPQSTFWLGTIG
jgi:hypothetical protein